jgi:hypothetical protein
MEVPRQAIEFGTVVVLVAAEGQSLYLLRETSSADPWLTSIGLAWGFVTVAAIALRGTGRARVTADLKVVEETPEGVTLQVGASNEFGNHDVTPLMNVMFGPGAVVFGTQADGTSTSRAKLNLSAPVKVGDRLIKCRYLGQRVLLTAGDAQVFYVRLKMETDADDVLVVVRLDHVEFDGGRCERAACAARPPSGSDTRANGVSLPARGGIVV